MKPITQINEISVLMPRDNKVNEISYYLDNVVSGTNNYPNLYTHARSSGVAISTWDALRIEAKAMAFTCGDDCIRMGRHRIPAWRIKTELGGSFEYPLE